jgi:hypothetical protein
LWLVVCPKGCCGLTVCPTRPAQACAGVPAYPA